MLELSQKYETAKHRAKPALHQKIKLWRHSGGLYTELYLPIPNLAKRINAEKHVAELQQLHVKNCDQNPSLVNIHRALHLRECARTHTSQTTLRNIKDLTYEVLPHPPYPPNLVPTDFYLFRHIQLCVSNKYSMKIYRKCIRRVS